MGAVSDRAGLSVQRSNVGAFSPGLGEPDRFHIPRDSTRHAPARVMRSTARLAVAWSSRTWCALDMVFAAVGFWSAHILSPRFVFADPHGYSIAIGSLIFAGSMAFVGCIFGVYERHNFMSVSRMAGQAIVVSSLALAATSLAYEWLGFLHIGRWVLLGTFIISTSTSFICRMAARELARRAKIRLILIGSRYQFRPLVRQIRLFYRAFYERPIYLSFDPEKSIAERRHQLIQAFIVEQPDEIVVMDDEPALADLMHYSARILRSGCGVYSYSAYHENLLGEVPVHCIDERAMLGSGFNVGSFHTGLIKRPLDILLASAGLVLGAPLMLLCAALVKLTSAGPIIYKQVRVGRYNRPFDIYKFRTMCVDAERDGAVWAKTKDVRITRVGQFLRKTRFDELPQLWNILLGHMSLVGPRPERPEFVEELRNQIPHYDLRHLVPPGLTGWAQVRFRYGSSIEDSQRKLAFDLFYVRRCSLSFDAAICLRTVAAMAKGAR